MSVILVPGMKLDLIDLSEGATLTPLLGVLALVKVVGEGGRRVRLEKKAFKLQPT